MKQLEAYELPFGALHMKKCTHKIAFAGALIILITIPLYFTDSKTTFQSFISSHKTTNISCSAPCRENEFGSENVESGGVELEAHTFNVTGKIKSRCDLFTGEWVPNPDGPYYTNSTCFTIQEHQNCMKFGRPDLGFLKWRWKPDECELPLFDPGKFLELVRGKSMAFVGDSVARNHMQSLICLLTKVGYPVDLASNPNDQNRRYEYRDHDFNITMFWSPYLVRTGPLIQEPFDLYLDQFHQHWTDNIRSFDYLIISAGAWFHRPTYFHVNNTRLGCLYCPDSNITQLTPPFSYRRAFQTAFRAINSPAVAFKGIAILRTFVPSHFEGGAWDNGGDCVRTGPYKRNETELEGYSKDMYLIQMEELRIAEKAGRGTVDRFRVLDVTKAMLLRPDGHPSKYGHWPVANRTFYNDCVHWCLPGPIDSWNDFLQQMLERETIRNKN